MKYFYTFLFSALLFPFFSYGQNNYKPGLVVTLKGDTIRGFIDYKEWENNPISITFKTTLTAAAQVYTSGEIGYFKVGKSEAYQKYNGPISMDEINVNRISRGRDTTVKTATVFLKIEQDGQFITLYSYADNLKKRYFVSEKTNKEPFELIYRTYFNTELDNNQTINEQKYKGQLIYLSSKYNGNSDALKSIIENAGYGQELVDVVAKINHSVRQARTHTNPGTSFYAGISSGATFIKPPNADIANFDPHVSPVNSYLPRIAIGINAYTNPDIGRLVFRGEIAVQASNFKTYYNEYMYSSARSYFTVNQKTISFNPNVLYNIYNSDRFKFYLEGGISANFSKYDNIASYNGQYKETQSSNIIYASNWFSFPLSTGIILNKKIGIFVTYTVPTAITGASYRYNSTQLGINYIFEHRKQ